MNSSEPRRDNVLLLNELDEIVEMLRTGRTATDVDEQITERLSTRGAMTTWALDNYKKGAKSFLIGNHRLLDWVGEGHTCEVYLAQQVFTGRVDVIKVLHPKTNNPNLHSRYLHTLSTQAKIASPRIVAVYEVGHSRHVDYAIVEHIAGADLRNRVRAGGALEMSTAAALTSEIANAVGALHAIGLVHAIPGGSRRI